MRARKKRRAMASGSSILSYRFSIQQTYQWPLFGLRDITVKGAHNLDATVWEARWVSSTQPESLRVATHTQRRQRGRPWSPARPFGAPSHCHPGASSICQYLPSSQRASHSGPSAHFGDLGSRVARVVERNTVSRSVFRCTGCQPKELLPEVLQGAGALEGRAVRVGGPRWTREGRH